MQDHTERVVGRLSPVADEASTPRQLQSLSMPSAGRGAPFGAMDVPNLGDGGPNSRQAGSHIQLQPPLLPQSNLQQQQQQQHPMLSPPQQQHGLGFAPGSQQPMHHSLGLPPVPPSPQQQLAGSLYGQQQQVPQMPAPQMQSQQQLQQQQQQQQPPSRFATGSPAPAAAPGGAATPTAQPPYVKFFMQRVTTNVAHVLFYVVDKRGFAKLAVVVSTNCGS